MYFRASAFDTFLCSHRQQIQLNGSFLELPENSKRLFYLKNILRYHLNWRHPRCWCDVVFVSFSFFLLRSKRCLLPRGVTVGQAS